MKSKTDTTKTEPKTSKATAPASSKVKHVKAARPGKPAVPDKKVTKAKIKGAAAVDTGQLALVTPVAPLTWDAISGFDPATLDNLSPEELATGINARQQFLDEALRSAQNGMAWSVRIACQIGLCGKAAKDRLPHGKFREWRLRDCSWLSERTLQRYMAISNPSLLADLKAGMQLNDLYKKLGKVVVEDLNNAPVKKAIPKEARANQDEAPITIGALLSQLKSTGEFLQSCVEDLPFDAPDASSVDELLSEIGALVTKLNAMKSKAIKARTPKQAKAFEVPTDANGVPLHSA